MINELFERYPSLKQIKSEIEAADEILLKCFKSGNKLLVCGNGGSCSDSDHIVGELMKGFLSKRPVSEDTRKKLAQFENGEFLADNLQGALPAVALTNHSALITAFSNDVNPDMIFAQQVFGYAKEGDVLIGITTSGNSKNVVYAAEVAKMCGMKVIALTGKRENKLDKIADVVLHAPETETFKVQELHLPIYHYLCAKVEKELF